MNLTRRNYQQENDYWRIRAFLREVMHANGRREFSWHVARLDYWRWHVNENIEHLPLEEAIFLWEDAQGRIAGVLNPEGKADVHLQIHPGLRTPQLEEEMIATAEEHLAEPGADGKHKLLIWADAQDELRQSILTRRGYVKDDWPEYQRRRSLDQEIPEASLAPGYTLRALGETDELPGRSWASWRAFHPDEPDEHYQGWEWYLNIQRMPLYRRDLDVVGVAPDGKIAAFCTIWYDDVTRTAYFEPVGTVPEHQRRGLGKALMFEGLRRMKRLGGNLAFVGSYSEAAGALYAAAGFTAYDLSEAWEKEWTIQPAHSR